MNEPPKELQLTLKDLTRHLKEGADLGVSLFRRGDAEEKMHFLASFTRTMDLQDILDGAEPIIYKQWMSGVSSLMLAIHAIPFVVLTKRSSQEYVLDESVEFETIYTIYITKDEEWFAQCHIQNREVSSWSISKSEETLDIRMALPRDIFKRCRQEEIWKN